MVSTQGAILAEPATARFLVFGLAPAADSKAIVASLRSFPVEPGTVIGIGAPLALALGSVPPGLRAFPAVSGAGVSFPSSQGAVWTAIGGDDPGATLHRARGFSESLGRGVFVQEEVSAFRFSRNRDLSGYEDGTENPKGDKAGATAFVTGAGPGLDGSSFVGVQRWQHDLDALRAHSQPARDALIGRRQDTNEEMEDAPASAHVKRAAQERFDPPAFMLRRSMPWGDSQQNGLYFVAYGASLDPFERVLKHMAGLDDGVVDGLTRFTRPLSGGYYWCPPLSEGRLDLRALGK